jgi:hypothetical protein
VACLKKNPVQQRQAEKILTVPALYTMPTLGRLTREASRLLCVFTLSSPASIMRPPQRQPSRSPFPFIDLEVATSKVNQHVFLFAALLPGCAAASRGSHPRHRPQTPPQTGMDQAPGPNPFLWTGFSKEKVSHLIDCCWARYAYTASETPIAD